MRGTGRWKERKDGREERSGRGRSQRGKYRMHVRGYEETLELKYFLSGGVRGGLMKGVIRVFHCETE